MKRSIFSKIFYLSILTFFCIQNALFAESTPKQETALEQIWSITEDDPSLTKDNLRDVLKREKTPLTFADQMEGRPEETWNAFSEPEPSTSNNSAAPWEIPSIADNKKEQKTLDSATQFAQTPQELESETTSDFPYYTELFFPIEKEHSQELIEPSSKKAVQHHASSENLDNENVELIDRNEEKWMTAFLEQDQPEENISTAMIHPDQQEEETFNQVASGQKTYADSFSDSSIGQHRVAVDSYYLPQKKSTDKATQKQSFLAQKTPYLEPRIQEPKKGIFGPRRPTPQAPLAQSSKKAKPSNTPQPVSPHSEELVIAQLDEENQAGLSTAVGQRRTPPKTILINFNNVSIIEYIRFISRIVDKNFIFDENDLQFNVTIISEEPTTLENVMTALIQELRIHDLSLIEQGNSFIIHKNSDVNSISRVNVDGTLNESPRESELVTQVFRLNTLNPTKAREIIQSLLSTQAIVETSEDTRHLIVTDIVTNIEQIGILLKSLDAPSGGLVIGQYVVRSSFMDTLIELARQIMEPIAFGQTLTFVPHPEANSIFIVSSPFLVDRTISVLHHLDYFQGTTRIYDLEDLKLERLAPIISPPGENEGVFPDYLIPAEQQGKWELNPRGNWIFRPSKKKVSPGEFPGEQPRGEWKLDPQNNWHFVPEGVSPAFRTRTPEEGETQGLLRGATPKGNWILDQDGDWIFQLSPGENIQPSTIVRPPKIEKVEIPVGSIDRIKFFIYKLEFCRGEEVTDALLRIGDSLAFPGTVNEDLLLTIQSAQWLQSNNSIVFTGTEDSLDKVKELIEEIDRPVRQVFIEMLILQTTIDDSLTYGVSWGTNSGGGNVATSQAFYGTSAAPLSGALGNTGIGKTPDATALTKTQGYNLGIIGQVITHAGTRFASLGVLLDTLHTKTDLEVILNPKIIVEDNKTAEIFVGENTAFQTESIVSEIGGVVTTNFEFRDVGTTLRVTPHICHDNLITLDIHEEVSSISPNQSTGAGTNPGPNTLINRTTTTVHVPNNYFVVLSGMLNDRKDTIRNQLPCLGAIPILGAGFSDTLTRDQKRNLMIFIRPKIIDTVEEINTLTKQQQQIMKQKKKLKKTWKYEIDEALDWLNIKPPACNECP